MFGKNKKNGFLKAVSNGECIPSERVPDEVFSEKMLGDGVAVIPSDGTIVSPVNGTVTQVFDTLHAYSILSDDGLEILVHIGINTVKLKGEGFNPKVKEGDRVSAGDVLCEADISFIIKNGCDIVTPVIITNPDSVKSLGFFFGKVTRGTSPIAEFSI